MVKTFNTFNSQLYKYFGDTKQLTLYKINTGTCTQFKFPLFLAEFSLLTGLSIRLNHIRMFSNYARMFFPRIIQLTRLHQNIFYFFLITFFHVFPCTLGPELGVGLLSRWLHQVDPSTTKSTARIP